MARDRRRRINRSDCRELHEALHFVRIVESSAAVLKRRNISASRRVCPDRGSATPIPWAVPPPVSSWCRRKFIATSREIDVNKISRLRLRFYGIASLAIAAAGLSLPAGAVYIQTNL